ncbi:MAG: carbohydrate kinase [Nitrospinae bacterium]|nr:carbohydrate kinase [Nitrospinota bacterium]
MYKQTLRPLIFGEVLFDVFPDKEILGGAPFNVAWNLKGFGLNPLFVSRVGKDERGHKIKTAMEGFGLDCSGLQMDEEFQTGMVKIELKGKSHTFNILPEQAYDFINKEEALKCVETEDLALLYHGSLISRGKVSKCTLEYIKKTIHPPVFVDVNLRPPWSRPEDFKEYSGNARWMKINNDELFEITGKKASDLTWLKETALSYMKDVSLQTLFLTLGEQGSLIIDGKNIYEGAGKRVSVNNIVDTVGAGDAYSSVVIMGILSQWSFQTIIERSEEFASAVCCMRGATTTDKRFYQDFLSKWKVI